MEQVAEMTREGLDSTLYRDDEAGFEMSEQEWPETDYILKHWMSAQDAAEIIGITRQAVAQACKRKPNELFYLRSVMIGDRWYIDPDAVKNYRRRYNN